MTNEPGITGIKGTQYLILLALAFGAGFAFAQQASEEVFQAVDECFGTEGAACPSMAAKAHQFRFFDVECEILFPVADVVDHLAIRAFVR